MVTPWGASKETVGWESLWGWRWRPDQDQSALPDFRSGLTDGAMGGGGDGLRGGLGGGGVKVAQGFAEFDEGEIDVLVGTEDFCFVGLSVEEETADFDGFIDDVPVGEDFPLRRNDDTGAGDFLVGADAG